MTDNIEIIPELVLSELSSIHDAVIVNLWWDGFKKVLNIGLDDLNSNYLGLPEYKDERPVELIFLGVSSLEIEVQAIDNHLRVYGIEITNLVQKYAFHIRCSPGGYLMFQCDAVKLSEMKIMDR